MATIAGLVVRISGDTSGLRKEINAAQRQLNNAFGTKGMAFSKGLVKGMAATGAAMGALGVKALAEASKLQKVQVAFTNLLGSAQKADDYIRKLYDFANQSPFSFEELANGAQRLMAMGYEGEEALETLRAIGDAAAGIGKGTEGIARISLALGQIKAKGTVQAEEMRQLAENGIPAWDMLAKKLGVDVATAMKMVEKRSVSAKTGIEALTEGMASKYGGMMEKQAKTIEGGWQVAMDGVQRVLAQTGLEIDKTFDVAKNLRGFGLTLAKFSDEIAASGVAEALHNLMPLGLEASLIGVATTITYAVVPALKTMAGNAWLAVAPFFPMIAAASLLAGAIYGVGSRMNATQGEIKEMAKELADLEGVAEDSDALKNLMLSGYSKYSTDDYDSVSKDFNIYAGVPTNKNVEMPKEEKSTSDKGDMAGPAVLAAAKRISKSINDEWNKLFKKRVEAVDRWYTEEKDALDKSASENINYLTDKQRLEELYVQKRLNALKEEAEATRKIREDVANLAYDSNVARLSLFDSAGSQEIEQMRLDYEKAIEAVGNKWVEQQNNFISMTKEEKETYLQALSEKGVAYEVNAKNELSFTEQIEKDKLAIQKSYADQFTEYYRQCKDVQANIDKAYANNSLSMLKQALEGENAERLTSYEANKAIMDAYYENWKEAHMSMKERVANTIVETKDSINTFFQDVLSYGSSFSESFGSLLSNIGSSIIGQVTGGVSASIASGLLGMFGGGEDKENPLGKASDETTISLKSLTAGLGTATGAVGTLTSGLGAYNAIESIITGTTKPAEATATVTVTSALGILATAALEASFALSAMAGAGGFGFFAKGGLVKAASGGAIYGAGTGTSDSIPAMLSNGEYVIRAAAVDKLGVPFLDALNTGDYAGFSTGGLVTPDYGTSGKQSANGEGQQINISLNVSAVDAESFAGFLRNGGLDEIRQALFDNNRNFGNLAGVW